MKKFPRTGHQRVRLRDYFTNNNNNNNNNFIDVLIDLALYKNM